MTRRRDRRPGRLERLRRPPRRGRRERRAAASSCRTCRSGCRRSARSPSGPRTCASCSSCASAPSSRPPPPRSSPAAPAPSSGPSPSTRAPAIASQADMAVLSPSRRRRPGHPAEPRAPPRCSCWSIATPRPGRSSSDRARRAWSWASATDELRMDYVPGTADVKPGDLVVTSGIDGIYPKGFVIGTIETGRARSGHLPRDSRPPGGGLLAARGGAGRAHARRRVATAGEAKDQP